MAVSVPNQWSATFTQPAAFGTTPPALQSVVLPLTPGTSVGGGSGTPTAGNWLFCVTGMNEAAATSGFTVAVGDDIHSFWRPGNETTSTWAVSTATALTRTAIWYTANTASAAGNVYIAPGGPFDALTVLVIEVAGLGAWDTVTGINTGYAAAATSLNLALGAPSGNAFLLAAVAGDNTTSGQAFAPASWTALHTVTVTDGADHLCDSVLTSAWITTSGSISVNGTASSPTDLSGAVIGVLTAATSPVPATHNPNWPLVKFEAAFGGGFQTPPDQLTWTDLTSRLWSWDETTGAQYQLGSIQATQLNLELDNFDNALAGDNPAALFYTSGNWSPQAAFYDNLVSAAPPLAWWKLNDAAGSGTAADSSGNGHTGTATSVTFGNASAAVTGNTSAAFASGSSSHVISSYNPSFTQLTVEAWVNLNSLSQSGNSRLVANSHTDSDSKGFQLFLDPSPHIYIGFTSGTANVKAPASLPASGWAYVAATYDGTNLLLYVNGVQVGAAVTTGTISAGTAAGIGLGYGAAYAGDYLNGLLAEAAVYGTALTASQVAARYTAGPSISGTPLRIRAAVGTLGGVTANRWYVIQKNAEEWPQQIDPAYRRYVPVTATDIWSALSNTGPTPYRGEVAQDGPYSWYAMDDQTLEGGVQPASLRNSAPGNTTAMSIIASPGGVTAGDVYSSTGADLAGTAAGQLPPSVATYAVAQQQGWMYGDPQASNTTYATTNPVTATPGSAAWQQTGLAGNTGSNTWFLAANDTGLPPLSAGATVEGWFNATFFGTAQGTTQTGPIRSNVIGQPYSVITLATLSTGSAPVAILQLDLTGHLNLITYNGTTPTSHGIYSTSDLRSGSWHQVVLTATTTTWTVYVDGGLTALVSGSATGMTSAWTWLTLNGDYGNTSGGGTPANIEHGGNVAYSHWSAYPSILPAWRILAHYSAAATGFGVLPAPSTVAASAVQNEFAGTSYTPDGSEFQGSYGYPGGITLNTYSFSGLAAAVAGSYTSGPSARAVLAGQGQIVSGTRFGAAVWLSWTSLSPLVQVFTAASANAETEAAGVCGSGDAFTTGYGSGATGNGVCQVSSGTGASPPAAPSALGDTVQQRIERCLYYGRVTYPGRCIDPAALQVQAATDIGGQQAGINVQNIVGSDGGLMFTDNLGNLTYWQKSHLAGQYASPAWTIGPSASPYYREINWVDDPQRVWNAIVITPFSPDGATLALISPNQAAQVNASQQQFGAQPKEIISYLQSQTEMQSQASNLFANFGILHARAENVKLDAAPDPALFPMILGINVGDVVTAQNWQIGSGGATGTFRVSEIKRTFEFGDESRVTTASVVLKLDWEPVSYWS